MKNVAELLEKYNIKTCPCCSKELAISNEEVRCSSINVNVNSINHAAYHFQLTIIKYNLYLHSSYILDNVFYSAFLYFDYKDDGGFQTTIDTNMTKQYVYDDVDAFIKIAISPNRLRNFILLK